MGMIFTFDQIERGHVPDKQDFTDIVAMLRGRLPHVAGFMGGILCGSVGKREGIYCNRRSDIDGIAVYDSVHHDAMRSAMQAIHEEAARRHVPLDFRTIQHDVVQNGSHGVSLSFRNHLSDAVRYENGEIGTDPLPRFVFRAREKADEARDYVARKLQSFEHLANQLHVLPDADLYRFLRKVIEAPVHAARKLLWAVRPHGLVPSDAKLNVISAYQDECTGNRHERRLFDRLILADEEYTRALPRHLADRDATEYAIQIGTIYSLIPDCMELLTMMLDRLAK